MKKNNLTLPKDWRQQSFCLSLTAIDSIGAIVGLTRSVPPFPVAWYVLVVSLRIPIIRHTAQESS